MNPNSFDILKKHISDMTALMLWQSQAIKIDSENPFQLVSGNYSPIYINCRQIISDPVFMNLFCSFTQVIMREYDVRPDIIAGGETAGIPFAAYVAHNLNLPMVYVRKKPKAHGTTSKVEGIIHKAAAVLLIEDLITDAGSKINFIEGIRTAGGVLDNVLVLFDREQSGREVLAELGINLHSITGLEVALQVGLHCGITNKQNLNGVYEYLNDPEEWHRNIGKTYRN